jgi:nucleotide-binding universal stress UspA family protein
MIKTILVPTGGSGSDDPLFTSALAAARPFNAHLAFFHVHLSPSELVLHAPHLEFTQGSALRQAIAELDDTARMRSVNALRHFREFCDTRGIEVVDRPAASDNVTASWREERDQALDHLLIRARHSDLVVIERATRPNGLPRDFVELLLLRSGRPLLLAPTRPPHNLTDTVMVAWKETPTAARALTAAMPFLVKAMRVVFLEVAERDGIGSTGLQDLVQQMGWHGIAADMEYVASERRLTAELLADAAQRHGASLLVMGGYGRSRTSETLFGGCTHAMLDHADFPILLQH